MSFLFIYHTCKKILCFIFITKPNCLHRVVTEKIINTTALNIKHIYGCVGSRKIRSLSTYYFKNICIKKNSSFLEWSKVRVYMSMFSFAIFLKCSYTLGEWFYVHFTRKSANTRITEKCIYELPWLIFSFWDSCNVRYFCKYTFLKTN